MMAKQPVPPCKGCGSTNLKAASRAIVTVGYEKPTHVEDGSLYFSQSYAGRAENERWSIECADCGRGMRTDLAPANSD
jgi:hypothetical protein